MKRTDVVTATGRVRMQRDGNYSPPTSDLVPRTGEVRAEAMSSCHARGRQAGRRAGRPHDSLRDGTVENLLIVLESGGRIAASRATRSDGLTTLEKR